MTTGDIDFTTAVISLALALGLSFGISALYTATYQGVSYLKGFAQTLALSGLASAAVMLCVGDSIARGIGIFGAVNLVQVRSTVKDTRDLMFVFITLAVGVASGVGAWGIALTATGLFTLAVLLQTMTDFGARRGVSAVLRLRVKMSQLEGLPQVLAKHTSRAMLSNSRALADDATEQTWQLRISGGAEQTTLLTALQALGAADVSLLLQDDSLEV